MRGFLVLAIADYEIYHKFANDVLETERTTVNISEPALNSSKGKKIATAETLTVDQGSLTVNQVAVIRYQYDNHLGSASLELDEQANIISYEEYHPFGTTSYRSGRTETETSQKRYKYVGKERDEETGLYYYGFRYYAAWLCRFVSVDPLQFEYPQLTPYNYAGNKPVTHIDIDGLQGDGDEKQGVDPIKEDSSSNAAWEFTKGTGRGLWGGLKGTWDFITDDAWKAQTWKATGNLLLGISLTYNNPAGITSLMAIDEKLGTNSFEAVAGLAEAIDQSVDKAINGSASDRGEVFGSVLYAIGESFVGSKGAGLIAKTKVGAGAIIKVKSTAKYLTKIENKIKPIAKAKLPKWVAESFTDGNYRTVITKEKITLYRTFGGKADAGGGYATTMPASNRIQAKIEAALKPDWGNTRMYEAVIEVPKDQVLNVGKVAEQYTKTGTKLAGQADQILLPENWPLEWIKEIRVVPSR